MLPIVPPDPRGVKQMLPIVPPDPRGAKQMLPIVPPDPRGVKQMSLLYRLTPAVPSKCPYCTA